VQISASNGQLQSVPESLVAPGHICNIVTRRQPVIHRNTIVLPRLRIRTVQRNIFHSRFDAQANDRQLGDVIRDCAQAKPSLHT
jgi:hypothetical protein